MTTIAMTTPNETPQLAFDTPKAWEEDLVRRMEEALQKKIDRQSRLGYDEIEIEHNLNELQEEDLENIFFGKIYDFENSSDDDNMDYQNSENERVFDSLMEDVFSDFSEELCDLAEALDIDEDELNDKFKEKNEFQSHEYDQIVNINHIYRGSVNAYLNLKISAELNPDSIDFFHNLSLLKINANDFLNEILNWIDESDADDLDHDRLGIDLETEDLDEDQIKKETKRAFMEIFEDRRKNFEKTEFKSTTYGQDESMLTPSQWLKFCLSNTSNEAYLHMTLDSDAIDALKPLSTHDINIKQTRILIDEAYLAESSNPGYARDSDETPKIKSAISVSPKDIRFSREKFQELKDSGVKLSSMDEIYSGLYKILLIDREKYNQPLNDSDKKDQESKEKALNFLDSQKTEVMKIFLKSGKLSNFNQIIEQKINEKDPMIGGQELARFMMSMVESMDGASNEEVRALEDQIVMAIDAKPDFNFSDPSGATLLHKALASPCSLETCQQIAASSQNPWVLTKYGSNAFDAAYTRLSKRGEIDREKSIKKMNWVIDHGVGLSENDLSNEVLARKKFNLIANAKNIQLTQSVIHKISSDLNQEIAHKFRDFEFGRSINELNVEVAAQLASLGAKPLNDLVVEELQKKKSNPFNSQRMNENLDACIGIVSAIEAKSAVSKLMESDSFLKDILTKRP